MKILFYLLSMLFTFSSYAQLEVEEAKGASDDAQALVQALSMGIDVDMLGPHYGRSLLMLYAIAGNMEAVTTLVYAGANILSRDRSSKTARMYAEEEGHLEIAEFLQEKEEELTPDEIEDYTHAYYVRASILIKLIPDGNANLISDPSSTYLILEASHGHANAVKALLKLGADPNKKDAYGFDARFYASKLNHTNVIEVLDEFINNQ